MKLQSLTERIIKIISEISFMIGNPIGPQEIEKKQEPITVLINFMPKKFVPNDPREKLLEERRAYIDSKRVKK